MTRISLLLSCSLSEHRVSSPLSVSSCQSDLSPREKTQTVIDWLTVTPKCPHTPFFLSAADFFLPWRCLPWWQQFWPQLCDPFLSAKNPWAAALPIAGFVSAAPHASQSSRGSSACCYWRSASWYTPQFSPTGVKQTDRHGMKDYDQRGKSNFKLTSSGSSPKPVQSGGSSSRLIARNLDTYMTAWRISCSFMLKWRRKGSKTLSL